MHTSSSKPLKVASLIAIRPFKLTRSIIKHIFERPEPYLIRVGPKKQLQHSSWAWITNQKMKISKTSYLKLCKKLKTCQNRTIQTKINSKDWRNAWKKVEQKFQSSDLTFSRKIEEESWPLATLNRGTRCCFCQKVKFWPLKWPKKSRLESCFSKKGYILTKTSLLKAKKKTPMPKKENKIS